MFTRIHEDAKGSGMNRAKVFLFSVLFFVFSALLFVFMSLPGRPNAGSYDSTVTWVQWLLSAMTMGIILFSGVYHLMLLVQLKDVLYFLFGMTCLMTVFRFVFEKGSVLYSLQVLPGWLNGGTVAIVFMVAQAVFGFAFFILILLNEVYRESPAGVLYFIGFAVLQIVGTGGQFVLGDRLYMPGLVANFFMMLTQALMLSQFYVGAIRQKQETALQNAALEEVNKQKDDFLANISHEMKTPLAVINGYLELCLDMEKQKPGPDERVIVNMTRALSEGNRAAHMTKQLLDIASIESGSMVWHFERVDIGRMAEDVQDRYFAMLNKGHNTLTLAIPGGLPDVRADGDQISRVLVNLIQNALRFTRNGTITVSAQEESGYVKVSVKDTGSGIPPELMPHLFERFYTGEGSTGSGLGLYICKQTIEAHGGSIGIKSLQGKGTEIHFTLPVWREGEGAEHV